MKKKYINNTRLFTLVLVSLACALLGYSIYSRYYSTEKNTAQYDNLSDSKIVYDLLILEKAIIAYSETSTGNVGNKLPSNISELQLQDLNGSLTSYEYTPITQSSNGGPTVSYKICTKFHDRSDNLDSPNYQPEYSFGSPEGYTYHHKGKQCFNNAYYKGSSHISLVKT